MKKCAGPDGPACDEFELECKSRPVHAVGEGGSCVTKNAGSLASSRRKPTSPPPAPVDMWPDQGTMWDAPSAQCILDADASACSATQYRDASGQCISYSPECSSNQYESVKPTAERDRECQNCSLCDPTAYISQGCTSDSDRQCSVYSPCDGPDEFSTP